ncbi:MAG: STAS domain-containing protein [Gemmatimonadales bacterium]|nr:STAS domain-containing protein [Gemmatimonadota bacterium]MCL4212471.1 STAS domain-containing protein [Gemmatimonadales bacterium]
MTRQSTVPVEAPMQPLFAPARLNADNRLEFRRLVLEQLENAAHEGADTIDVDLGGTVEMDASGLGVLVLLQKRARERGLRTRLVHTPRPVFETLRLTRLDALFEFPTTS